MISTQQILNGIVDMQARAQEALPVIPNNGNPMGAHNMASTPAATAPITQPALPTQQPKFPWLEPSQSMNNITQMLAARRDSFMKSQTTPYQSQPAVPVQTPVVPNDFVMPMFQQRTV